MFVSIASFIRECPVSRVRMGIDEKKMSPFDTLFTRNVPHILEKIFFSLDYESYKLCLEVSKVWNDLLSTESYKKRAKYEYKQEISDDVKELYRQSNDGNIDAVMKIISIGLVDVNSDDEGGYTQYVED